VSQNSLGMVVSLPHGMSSAAPEELNETRNWQRRNLESLRKRLDKLPKPCYNVSSEVQTLLNLLCGDFEMANSRKASVSSKQFLSVYIPAVQAENQDERKTTAEIAKELGMSSAAVSARASSLRAKIEAKGKTLNYPKSGRGATASVDATLDSFADMLADLNPPTDEKSETESVPAAE
jgi:hypothetical protein